MSLVTAIRDYVDLVNSSYDSVPINANIQSWLMPMLACALGGLKQAMVYLLSFQWVRDLVYLPLLIPQLSLSVLRENCYPLDNPLLNFFTFLEEPAYRDNKLFVGLLNSLFACLPLSATHLLSGRRLLVQGVPAGVAAGSGIVLGQCWFVACVIFGLRPFLIPWLTWEPLNYILGIGLLVNTVYRITHERKIRVIKWTNRGELIQYFLLSLVLTWCEQTSIFQYLGNLTVGAEPTALDIFSSSSEGGSLLTDGAYVGGFAVGSAFFAFFYGWLALQLRNLWVVWWSTTPSRIINWLNRFFLITLVAFSFASVPYYGFDYLATSRLGFLPNDASFDGTILAPTTIGDINQMLGRASDAQSFDTDVSTFDRGDYLRESGPAFQSFEDLNYQAEYAWTRRLDKQVRHVHMRRAHPFWHKLLSGVAQSVASDQPQSTSRGAKQMEQGGNSLRASKLGDKWLIGKSPSIEDEMNMTGGDSDTVAELLDQRAKLAAELAELAAADDEEKGEAGSNSREVDKQFERQFMEEFTSGLTTRFPADDPPMTALAKAIKQRYTANPIYSLLLRADIDTFLGRQPSSNILSPTEENSLFQRRQLLSQYYDALRQYKQLQNWKEFEALQQGSKSFASRVYNQQFKGTLKVVRRLFSMSLNEDELDNRRVLKIDQPLFEKRQGQNRAHTNLHEELGPLAGEGIVTSPFIENTNPKPLYTGWDEEMRKLVLTNRSLPRSKALYGAGVPSGASRGKQYKRFNNLLSGRVGFTAWPIPREHLSVPKSQSGIPYQVAFESAQDPQKQVLANNLEIFGENTEGAEGGWEMFSWPTNLGLRDALSGVVPATRGGFVWPGHAPLRIGQTPTEAEAK